MLLSITNLWGPLFTCHMKLKITSLLSRTLVGPQVWWMTMSFVVPLLDYNSRKGIISSQSRYNLSYQIIINKYLKTNIQKTFQTIGWRTEVWVMRYFSLGKVHDCPQLGAETFQRNGHSVLPSSSITIWKLPHFKSPVSSHFLASFPLDILHGRFQFVGDYLPALWFSFVFLLFIRWQFKSKI